MPEPEQALPSSPAGEPSGADPSPDVVLSVRTNRVGVAALVCGLIGMLGFIGLIGFWVLAPATLLSPVAVVLGLVGIAKARRSGASTGMAAAGLTLGLVVLVLYGLFLLAFALSSGD
jgi:hypothetical protein